MNNSPSPLNNPPGRLNKSGPRLNNPTLRDTPGEGKETPVRPRFWVSLFAAATLLLTGAVPSSAALAAGGGSAAAEQTPARSFVKNGPPEFRKADQGTPPKGIQGIKGMPSGPGFTSTGAAEATGKSKAFAPCSPPACFFYSTTYMSLGGVADGMFANCHIYDTYINYTSGPDDHSLCELAVSDVGSGSRNVVEVGSTVDPGVCGAAATPCMFVFWWKAGVPQCYNGCGFVPYTPTCSVSANYCAGESLNALDVTAGVGDPYRFGIQHSSGAWWIAFDGKWIGSYPDTLWTAAPSVTFTSAKVFQGFYELASQDTLPCGDMGNGNPASSTSAARIGSAALVNSVPLVANNFTSLTVTSPYTQSVLSGQTSRNGGPGYKANGTTPGNKDSC